MAGAGVRTGLPGQRDLPNSRVGTEFSESSEPASASEPGTRPRDCPRRSPGQALPGPQRWSPSSVDLIFLPEEGHRLAARKETLGGRCPPPTQTWEEGPAPRPPAGPLPSPGDLQGPLITQPESSLGLGPRGEASPTGSLLGRRYRRNPGPQSTWGGHQPRPGTTAFLSHCGSQRARQARPRRGNRGWRGRRPCPGHADIQGR